MAFVAGMALALSLGSPSRAEPPPFQDFTFKRVKVPSPTNGPRITVQINEPVPTPKAKEKPEVAKAAFAAPAASALDWFWDDISPDLTAAAPDRLAPALVRLSNPPEGVDVPEPRLSELLAITKRYGPEILMSTIGTRVSPALALAVISVESGGRADATSGVGAQGVMQLMPAAAERFGVGDRLDPAQNIRGGVRYLDQLMKDFDNDPLLVLAGYNAGENAVRKHGGVPPFAETRDYVPKVLAAFSVARGLCLTPPELVSDGCAFRQP
jgi:soluble lytic murein transglycosylase-like protein